eukprot:15354562-Ditylum_brightwellii.AAC.1
MAKHMCSYQECCTFQLCQLQDCLLHSESCYKQDFVVAYHTGFVEPHFTFLQLGDLRTENSAYFQCHHTVVQYFIMINDPGKMREGRWRTHPDSVGSYDDSTNEEQKLPSSSLVCGMKNHLQDHLQEK